MCDGSGSASPAPSSSPAPSPLDPLQEISQCQEGLQRNDQAIQEMNRSLDELSQFVRRPMQLGAEQIKELEQRLARCEEMIRAVDSRVATMEQRRQYYEQHFTDHLQFGLIRISVEAYLRNCAAVRRSIDKMALSLKVCIERGKAMLLIREATETSDRLIAQFCPVLQEVTDERIKPLELTEEQKDSLIRHLMDCERAKREVDSLIRGMQRQHKGLSEAVNRYNDALPPSLPAGEKPKFVEKKMLKASHRTTQQIFTELSYIASYINITLCQCHRIQILHGDLTNVLPMNRPTLIARGPQA